MTELPYSFHLGSNKNRRSSARASAKNNRSNSTSLANNGIQNLQQLSKVNNHDFRKYENNNELVYQLKGTNDIVYDVKEFYKKEFEEARIEYNDKQSRPSRRIDDYFEYVNKDEKRDLACEIIIELGNKAYWDTKDFEFKRDMVNVYEFHLRDLKELVPEFKVTTAVVHLDETSPHMHIIGVPVKDNCKTGLSKQVNKSAVFTKQRLEHIQNVMREKCINRFNITFKDEKATLKEKEKGRNIDINVKDMVNYDLLKEELEFNKESIKKNNDKIKNINKVSNQLKEELSNIDESRFGGYKLNKRQKERLEELMKDVESLASYFDNYGNIMNNLNAINEDLKYQKHKNVELKNNIDKIQRENIKLKDDNKVLRDDKTFIKSVMDKRMDERNEFITYLCKGVNSKDPIVSRKFESIAEDMHNKKFISRKERFVIFNPPRLISKSEIENALHHINQQMEQEAEYYRQQRVKDMNETNENDFLL